MKFCCGLTMLCVAVLLSAMATSCTPAGAGGSWFSNPSADIIELVDKGDIEAVKKLIERDPSAVNASNSWGATPLMVAAANRQDVEMCRLLLSKGAKVDVKDKKGFSILDWVEVGLRRTDPPQYGFTYDELAARNTGVEHKAVTENRYIPPDRYRLLQIKEMLEKAIAEQRAPQSESRSTLLIMPPQGATK